MQGQFQYSLFGYPGKKSISKHVVWEHWGSGVKYYLDPFFGTGQVFWAAPELHRAALNDKNGFAINFWRMIKYCDLGEICNAVETIFFSELEYHAQKKRLFGEAVDLRARLVSDYEYVDFGLGVLWFQLCKLSFPNFKRSAGFRGNRWERKDLMKKITAMQNQIHRKTVTVLSSEDWTDFMIQRGYLCIGLKPPRDLNRHDIAILVDPPYTGSTSLYDMDEDIAPDVYDFFRGYAKKNPDVRYCICGWRDDLEKFFPGWNVINVKIGNTRTAQQTESLAFNAVV